MCRQVLNKQALVTRNTATHFQPFIAGWQCVHAACRHLYATPATVSCAAWTWEDEGIACRPVNALHRKQKKGKAAVLQEEHQDLWCWTPAVTYNVCAQDCVNLILGEDLDLWINMWMTTMKWLDLGVWTSMRWLDLGVCWEHNESMGMFESWSVDINEMTGSWSVLRTQWINGMFES